MAQLTKFIVMSFRRRGKTLQAGETREARNAEAAERLASNMSVRFDGVAAYKMTIDEDTGEMIAAALLFRHGEIRDFLEEMV